MKNSLLFSSALCVIIGLLLGALFPMPWDKEAAAPAANQAITTFDAPHQSELAGSNSVPTPAPEPLNPQDNFPLLNTACAVCRALQNQDYSYLSSFVHPEKGVTLTPYSTVNFDTDRTLSAQDIAHLTEDPTIYPWGYLNGREKLIELSSQDYFSQYVWNADYTQAPEIGVNTVITSGNALENVAEAYPGCRFVDFSFPLLSADNQGFDWCSLKLVFEPGEHDWYLVGIIHSQWTV